ncbi:hypothetical protein EV679_0325 [Kerstersia gyiorum]|uniref:Uncharacterized protein n=1 Tax=Kerstersia gyiorum TaxID=206506 RepID=A0A4V2F1B8_9BURK|nr:hypothetical protein [Kerstersia gyiorum]KAB0544158.1 hypothetical protein F7P85_05955 [Kerstersia gyiorum]RZS73137.1 hypothetical protein EV679_0325 [Kerstersia gyiorum]
MDTDIITIALRDGSRGYEISPERVPLSVLADFSKDVRDFIRGAGDDIDIANVDVGIIKGSLAISAVGINSPSLVSDLRMLASSEDISKITSKKRREVIRKWQSHAYKFDNVFVRIASPWSKNVILISKTTAFREIDQSRLVTVERYIRGEIQDLGGARESNAHVRLPDGKTLTVRTDRELIKRESENLVYKEVHLRIRAKMNLDTGKLSDPELIEFVDYKPKFDEEKFQEAVRKGREAWRDIGDPAAWVRLSRGDD